MDIPNEVKEMIGNKYLFSGTFLNDTDVKETEYLVLDARMSDAFLKDKENKFKHPCFELLLKVEDEELWTKPFPIKTINLKLNIT